MTHLVKITLAFEFSVTSARAFDRAHAEVSVERLPLRTSASSCQGCASEKFKVLRTFVQLHQLQSR
jgi:hypothetical protein